MQHDNTDLAIQLPDGRQARDCSRAATDSLVLCKAPNRLKTRILRDCVAGSRAETATYSPSPRHETRALPSSCEAAAVQCDVRTSADGILACRGGGVLPQLASLAAKLCLGLAPAHADRLLLGHSLLLQELLAHDVKVLGHEHELAGTRDNDNELLVGAPAEATDAIINAPCDVTLGWMST